MSGRVERCFAAADMYQILGYFVVTPTAAVADGLYEGALAGDIESVADELGLEEARESLGTFRRYLAACVQEEDADAFFHRVRKDYTHLYTNPQFSVSTLYQSRFMGNEEGARGLEIALAPMTQELKALYAEKGFEPRFVPALRADHMAVQLAFMQALRTNEAIALRNEDEAAGEIAATARDFLRNHLGLWAVEFFEEMAQRAEEEVYRFIGELGATFVRSELS